jgi:hypothetical protein
VSSEDRRKRMIAKARGGLPLTAEEREEREVQRVLAKAAARRAPEPVEETKPVTRRVIKRSQPKPYTPPTPIERELRLRERELEIAARHIDKLAARTAKPQPIHIHMPEQNVIINETPLESE